MKNKLGHRKHASSINYIKIYKIDDEHIGLLVEHFRYFSYITSILFNFSVSKGNYPKNN
jgi:hypothetical protein